MHSNFFEKNFGSIIVILTLRINLFINKKFTFKMKKSILFLSTSIMIAVVVFLSGCASSTMIKSIPSGAKVYINGEPVGVTPYLYTDTKVIFSPVNVDIIKEGYKPVYETFHRDEEFNAGTFIGGIFVWPLWLWTLDYKSTHTFELVPVSEVVENEATREIQYTGSNRIEKLKELKQMYDEKLITEEDYKNAKQKILEEK